MDRHKIHVGIGLALCYFSISAWEGNGRKAVPAGGKGMSQVESDASHREGDQTTAPGRRVTGQQHQGRVVEGGRWDWDPGCHMRTLVFAAHGAQPRVGGS